MKLALSQKTFADFLARWGPACAWMALIFFFSSLSRPPFVPGGEGMAYLARKLGHFTEYAILAWLIDRPLRARRHGAWLTLGLAMLYGASDEWHQSFVPGREMLFGDWLIDSAGAFCGLFVALQWRKWLARTGAQK